MIYLLSLIKNCINFRSTVKRMKMTSYLSTMFDYIYQIGFLLSALKNQYTFAVLMKTVQHEFLLKKVLVAVKILLNNWKIYAMALMTKSRLDKK